MRYALAYLVARLGVLLLGVAGWIDYGAARQYIADVVKAAKSQH